MGEGELDFAVRYPFSSSAKELLKTEGFSAITDEIVELAVNRILDSMHGRPKKKVFTSETDKKEDLLSYAVSRMILSHLRNRYLVNKFAVGESKRIRSYLNDEKQETVEKIAAELGIFLSRKDDEIYATLPIFLRFTPRSPHYQLTNRTIKSGLILVNESEEKRMIEEAARKRTERVPIVKNPPKRIIDAGKRILAELPKREVTAIAKIEDSHPPCIAELIDAVKKHQNLSHPARFYLAVYLMGIGLNDEKIIRFFSNFPDFSEKITKYQVEHARKRGYTVPSCSTIAGYGLCRANCRIGNPLNWHKRGRK